MNQTKTTPKDFFLHLGATITLYAAAIALINLSFSVINYFFPDALAGSFFGNTVAWPISMLIVLVPLFYVFEWLIARDIRTMPEKAELMIRKWRIYLTMFLAGATIVGDLIALIYTYLNGEIGARFVVKVLAVLIIAGVIFAYCILERSMSANRKGAQKTLAWAGIALVVIAIVIGFIAVGSPSKQRDLRFDAQRVNDLSTIQWQILTNWQQKGKLPATLDELTDKLSGFTVPVDPETKAPYEYSTKAVAGTKTGTSGFVFELCATFARSTPDTKGRGSFGTGGGISYPAYDMSYPYPGGGLGDTWKHEAGRMCFERTIDPEKYPVTPKPAAATM